MARTISANFSKSARFDEMRGTRSKNGMTDERAAIADHEHQRAVGLAVGLDVATPQSLANELQNFGLCRRSG